MATCELCLAEIPDSPFRAAGMDICRICWTGGLDQACAAWGLRMDAKHWTEWVSSGSDSSNRVLRQYSEVRIDLCTRNPATARFDREHPPPKWIRWLGLGGAKDLQIGDPLFDDYVRINPFEGDVLGLLADEGLQTGISTVTAEGGRVEIGHDYVFVRQSQGESAVVDQGEINARVVAIAVHVEKYAHGLR